jgi:hypothetical protein
MGMTANKLPTALRDALIGGTYDEGSLRLDLILSDGITTDDLRALGRIGEIGDSENVLFGWHEGDESDDWPVPTLSFAVFNEDGRYTPGGGASILPADISGWEVTERYYERITTTSWVKFFEQKWLLSEVQLSQGSALLLCTHPMQGMLSFTFPKSMEHDIDWNGYPHNITY